jgi:hypothetical protein
MALPLAMPFFRMSELVPQYERSKTCVSAYRSRYAKTLPCKETALIGTKLSVWGLSSWQYMV